MYERFNDIEQAVKGVIDFGLFDGCMKGDNRKSLSDIDGIAERRGQFLFVEKKYHGGLTTGQRILLEHLNKERTSEYPNGNKAILLIYGDEHNPRACEIWEAGNGTRHYFRDATVQILRDIISLWYDAADERRSASFTALYEAHERALWERTSQNAPVGPHAGSGRVEE